MTELPPDIPADGKQARAVQQASAIGAAVGSAAGAAVTETGMMGLKGMFGLIGNTTAMVTITVFMFLLYRDSTSSQRAETQYLREEIRRAAIAAVTEAQINRQSSAERQNNIFNAIHQMEAKLETNNKELASLARELRKQGVLPKSTEPPP